MASMFESTAEEALLAEFKAFQREVLTLKARDKGFNYLVAQHGAIHDRLRAAANALDRADPAVVATLLKQRALVLNEIATRLMDAEQDDELPGRRGGA